MCIFLNYTLVGNGFENTDRAVAHIQNLLNYKVAARWYQMGVVLGVPVSELESIRNGKDTDAGIREAAMLRTWLKTSLLPQTWQVLVDAVGHDAGGNHRAQARKIATKFNTEQGLCTCSYPHKTVKSVLTFDQRSCVQWCSD